MSISKPLVVLGGVLLMTTQVNSSLLRTDLARNGFKPCLQNNSMETQYSSILRTVNNSDTASFLRCRGET